MPSKHSLSLCGCLARVSSGAQVQDGRLTEAAEMLGESNPFGRTDQDVDLDGGLKVRCFPLGSERSFLETYISR